MFRYLIRTWKDITQDATAHTVALDLFKAISFFSGIFYFLVLIPVTLVLRGVELPDAAGFFLVANGFGLTALKIGAKYLARKTADESGNPLATPDSVEPPATEPELMPTVLSTGNNVVT